MNDAAHSIFNNVYRRKQSSLKNGPAKGQKTHTKVFLALFLAIFISIVSPITILAANGPVLSSPANNATGVDVTNITFSWQKYSDVTTEYYFELATDENFTNKIKEETITGGALTYQFTDTLQLNTKYYWRVTSSDAEDWSVASFTTKGSQTTTTGATDGTNEQGTGTSDNNTGAGGPGNSFIDTILGFINDVGWPLFLGMVFVLLIVIILIAFLLTKPKKAAPAGGSFAGRSGAGAQQGTMCATCGTMNSPERKFCANCGSPVAPPQYQARQQQQQQFGQQPTGACTNCGTVNAPGRQFCGTCGSKLVPPQQQAYQTQQFQQTSCPTCGIQLQPGQQFCGNCGTNVAGSQQQQQQQAYSTYETQTFACPICGATINKGVNPCPGCGTWLDWGR